MLDIDLGHVLIRGHRAEPDAFTRALIEGEAAPIP